MASLCIPEKVKLRKITASKMKSKEEIANIKTYYERNREKCLAKSREKYEKENQSAEYSGFSDFNEKIESGQWFYDCIADLKGNKCSIILTELGKTNNGKTHRYLSSGLVGRGYGTKKKLPILKKELNALERGGFIEKKGSGSLYCLTEKGRETAGKLERLLVPYESGLI